MLRKSGFTRAAATAAAVCVLVAAVPQTASAEVDNLWSVWASEVTDRSMIELPFVILVSVPVMLLTTPFWFGVWSVDKIKNSGDDAADEADAADETDAADEADAVDE